MYVVLADGASELSIEVKMGFVSETRYTAGHAAKHSDGRQLLQGVPGLSVCLCVCPYSEWFVSQCVWIPE